MNIRQANLKMIKAYNGGKDALAVAMGMVSTDAFDNRLYNKKGQAFTVEEEMAMQALSSTAYFAQAIAIASGGVFVKLQDAGEVDNDELLKKWNALYAELGSMSGDFNVFIADEELDEKERQRMIEHGNEINRIVQELLALTFRVYSRQGV